MMKQLLLSALMMGMLTSIAEARQASETSSNLIQQFLMAYNSQDTAYFDRTLANNAVILDEDGHTLTGKDLLMRILGARLSATPAPRLVASDITGSNAGEVAWGSLNYTFEQGDETRSGFMTLVFQGSGNDWEIAHWQFSIHTMPED
jgi:ketosteroid isomerase-like protein